MPLPRNVIYYGSESPLPNRTALRAGPLSLVFEAGDLRYIRLGDREVLRRVYMAVRDRKWGTPPPRLSNIRKEVKDESFRISYDAETVQSEIDFVWQGTITGNATGTVTFTMQGEARSTFLRNRLGFCILHPIRECAGAVCKVERVDGTVVQATFPRYISPHQPFMDMRAISHEVVPGVWAEVRFDGEIFEMEDQRNWADASYKTYCTPLRLPYPVEVEAGTRFAQSVTLGLKGSVPQWSAGSSTEAVNFIVETTPALPLPRIGLGVASHDQPLGPKELFRLRALNIAHLRVDLNLSHPAYDSYLARATNEAAELGVPLEAAVTVTDAAEDELLRLRAMIDQLKPAICTWLIFQASEKSTGEKWIRLARSHLSSYDPKVRIGAGTNAYFAELNRDRSPVSLVDLICYPVNPQVHAFDNATIVENLKGQAFTVESARRFAGKLPIAVTPITLKTRFDPQSASRGMPTAQDELPPDVDPRQMSLLGAGWTAGSLKYLAEAGTDSVTYYETTGQRGVMETEEGSLLREKFRSLPGGVFPLYHVLADAGEFAAGGVVCSTSNAPLKVDGLVLRNGELTRIMLVNLSPAPQFVRVTDATFAARVYVKILDESCVEAAMLLPESFRAEAGVLMPTAGGSLDLELRPFAIARIDSVRADTR
jgi:hypothetical protein